MTRIVTILTEGFADWETTLLNGVARSWYKVDTQYATPGGKPVTSSGGMQVVADVALEDIDPSAFDAVIVCGGNAWQSDAASDIVPLLRRAIAADKVLGLICDGTWAAAKAGILDDVAHTSNGAGYLDNTGYAGKANYRDTAEAVTDGKVVTAPGTSPVNFMVAIMTALGLADDDLRYYTGLHAAQFGKAA